MSSLNGRTALVTGASRGIGAACARALAAAGARVAIAARSEQELQRVAADLPGEAVVLVSDLAADGASSELAARAVDALGRIDVLVNNAGAAIYRPSEQLRESEVDRILDLNVRAVLMLATAIGAIMKTSGGGAIVNISSVAGQIGTPYQAPYCASKGAVDALTRALASEWGPNGVRVNAVAPGVIATDMWELGRSIPGVIESIEQRVALRRWGTAADVADVVVFLASDASRYVTGQTIGVDGGLATVAELLPR